MKKRNALRLTVLAAILLSAVNLLSCKSTPDLAPVDAFDVLSPGAAVYLSVPVQANAEFVSNAIQKIGRLAESDAQKISERLDIAYIALGSNGEIQLSAQGNLPTTFVGLALSEKNGWKGSALEGQTVYTHQQTMYQLCVPSSSNAFLSRDVAPMTRRFNKIAYAEPNDGTPGEKLLSEMLSERPYRFLHENKSADIMLYASNPRVFISSFLGGVDVTSPISSAYATLSQYRGVKEQFNVKLILNFSDTRTIKATVAMLKLAFFGGGVPAKVVQTAQNQITITDLPVTQTQILALLS